MPQSCIHIIYNVKYTSPAAVFVIIGSHEIVKVLIKDSLKTTHN